MPAGTAFLAGGGSAGLLGSPGMGYEIPTPGRGAAGAPSPWRRTEGGGRGVMAAGRGASRRIDERDGPSSKSTSGSWDGTIPRVLDGAFGIEEGGAFGSEEGARDAGACGPEDGPAASGTDGSTGAGAGAGSRSLPSKNAGSSASERGSASCSEGIFSAPTASRGGTAFATQSPYQGRETEATRGWTVAHGPNARQLRAGPFLHPLVAWPGLRDDPMCRMV